MQNTTLQSFIKFVESNTGHAAIVWSKFNPPTKSHAVLLDKLSECKCVRYVFASQTSDKSLSLLERIDYLRKMFPKHGRSIIEHDCADILEAAVRVYSDGNSELTVVAPASKVLEFSTTLNYNNRKSLSHGFYNFKSIKVLSVECTDPDAVAKKAVALAESNDFTNFRKMMPIGFKHTQALFNSIRLNSNLPESKDFKIKLETKTSQLRENYVAGKIYNVGDKICAFVEPNVELKIVHRGANHVVAEDALGVRHKYLITDIKQFDSHKLQSFKNFINGGK